MHQQNKTWLFCKQVFLVCFSRQSLLTFELFSVMVHSGSAAGGHYYACIKSFSDGQWYSFNDQHVSKVSLSPQSELLRACLLYPHFVVLLKKADIII